MTLLCRRTAHWWLVLAVLGAVVVTGCTSLSTTKSCSTTEKCSAAGAKQFGQAVLMPKGATFVQGSIKNGVLGVQFRVTPTGQPFSMFVGHPKSSKPACPGTVVVLSPTKRFCYGQTTAGLIAQFTTGNLLYTITLSPAPTDSSSDQQLVTQIVSTLS